MINIANISMYLENDMELEEVVENGISVLKLYKPTCAPCQQVTQELNQLMFDNRANATIYEVNVGDYPEVAGEYSVFGVPTLVFLKDGEVYHKHNGLIKKEEVLKLIQDHM